MLETKGITSTAKALCSSEASMKHEIVITLPAEMKPEKEHKIDEDGRCCREVIKTLLYYIQRDFSPIEKNGETDEMYFQEDFDVDLDELDKDLPWMS